MQANSVPPCYKKGLIFQRGQVRRQISNKGLKEEDIKLLRLELLANISLIHSFWISKPLLTANYDEGVMIGNPWFERSKAEIQSFVTSKKE